MCYILCSMLKSSNKKTVKNVFYAVGAILTYDTYDGFKCDYKISDDDDINNEFLTKLVNTILSMSNDEFFNLLKMLDDNNII